MDASHFDRHIQRLGEPGTRRRVLQMLALLPVVGELNALASGIDTAVARRRAQESGQPQAIRVEKHKKRKKRCAKAGQPTNQKHKTCCKGLVKGPDGRCTAPVSSCDVCASGCRYATIQAAIGDPAGPRTIRICPGRYRENVSTGKSVTLVGAGQGNNPAVDTIVDATGTNDIAVNISTGITVALQNLRITGGGPTADGGGIFNGGALLTVTNCTITGNRATNGGGIFHLDHKLTLSGCTITGNNADQGGGIFNGPETVVELLNGTVISGNTATQPVPTGGGILNEGSVSCPGGTVGGNTPDNCVDFVPGSGCESCPAA